MSENISRKFRCYWIIAPAFLVPAIAVCGMQDTFGLKMLIPALLILLLMRHRAPEPVLADLLVAGIWVWEAILQLFSIAPAASLPVLTDTTAAVLYYYVLRIGFPARVRMRSLVTTDSLLFGLLAVIGAIAFLLFRERILSGGFDDLYDFRFLYMPLGNLTNVWSNLLLGFLGTILIALHYGGRPKRIILLVLCLIPVCYGLIVSFSRGTYLALGFLIAALTVYAVATRRPSRRVKFLIAAIIVIGSALLIAPYSVEVGRTLRMNESASQQRSTEGRFNAAETALKAFREHPVTGSGSNTYSLLANPYLYENVPESYTANASSILIQIATEKGVVGTMLWAFLLVVLVREAVRSRKRTTLPLFVLIPVFALLLREATFPVLLGDGGLLLIFFTWAAILQNGCRTHPLFRTDRIVNFALRWTPLVIWAVLLTATLLRSRENKILEQSADALRSGDPALAWKIVDGSRKDLPGRVNRSLILLRLYDATGDTALLTRAAQEMEWAVALNPRDFQLDYNRAVILARSGKKEAAAEILTGLTERFPENPLYRSALFSLLSSSGEPRNGLQHLVRAVCVSPALLDTPLCPAAASGDSSLAGDFRRLLAEAVHAKAKDPVALARQARILLYLGDTVRACSYWRESVAELPNLSRPWAYLGMAAYRQGDPENGRRFLKASLAINNYDPLTRYYWETCTGENLPRSYLPSQGEYQFLFDVYQAKYAHWYGSRALPQDSLFGPEGFR